MFALVGGLGFLTPGACDKPVGDVHTGDTEEHSPISPRQTYRRLRQWQREHAYLAMRPYLDPGSRDQVIDLLVAMDELTTGAKAARAALQSHHPDLVGLVDLSGVVNLLGPFSRDVRYVGEQRDTDRAVLSVVVGGRLPPEEFAFERRQDRWVYMAPAVDREWITGVRDMSFALYRMVQVLSSKPLGREAVLREYHYRVTRYENRIREIVSASRYRENPSAVSSTSPF